MLHSVKLAITMTKIGRNDPCPCGSGKKYKKCCATKALGPRKVTVQSAGNMMGRISSLSQGLGSASLSGRIKPLSDRVSQGGKDISASEVLKKDKED